MNSIQDLDSGIGNESTYLSESSSDETKDLQVAEGQNNPPSHYRRVEEGHRPLKQRRRFVFFHKSHAQKMQKVM